MSGSESVCVLVVGIGQVPVEMLAAAEHVLGPLSDVEAAPFAPSGPADEIYDELRRRVEALDRGAGVLIIADLCGSTLANAAYRLSEQRPSCEVLCGANLAMLMKLFSEDRRRLDAHELGESLAETGRQGINLCRDKLCGAEAVRSLLGQEDAT